MLLSFICGYVALCMYTVKYPFGAIQFNEVIFFKLLVMNRLTFFQINFTKSLKCLNLEQT